MQNPGRASQGGGSDSATHNNKGGNIFSGKVRKASNPTVVPRIEANDNEVSSGADEGGESDEDEDEEEDEDSEDNETPSEKEWNLREEMTFEKICLTLLNE